MQILLKGHEEQLDLHQRNFFLILEPVHPDSDRYRQVGVRAVLSSDSSAIAHNNLIWPSPQVFQRLGLECIPLMLLFI
jgi:hypothetical protein